MKTKTRRATHLIQEYVAIIPKIQNVYPAEEARRVGWEFGFKYESGVFEFFSYKTLLEAQREQGLLVEAIERYYEPTRTMLKQREKE